MHHLPRRFAWRRAGRVAAVSAIAAATVAAVVAGSAHGGWDEDLHTDSIKITDPGIDLGNGTWVGATNDPLGSASVEWTVDNGFYSARVTGWLHLDDIPGHHGRIHVSFWNYSDLVSTRHSTWRAAPSNNHDEWSVDLSDLQSIHITEVHVCTELSDDGGATFDFIGCEESYL